MPNETHSNPIADALVLVFATGTSAKSWQSAGILSREWHLYAGLLPHFRQLVLITADASTPAENLAAIAAIAAPGTTNRLRVVSAANEPSLFSTELRAAVAGCRSAVIKSPLDRGGEVGLHIARSLRKAGLAVGLIARGGLLWSKFVAHEHGPHSLAHNEVAAIEGRLCQGADVVVGTTQDMIDDLSWRYHLPPGKGRVIPNYVSNGVLNNVLSDAVSSDDDHAAPRREPSTIFYAGPLIARKRIELLIESLALLSDEKRASTTLELAGTGPEQTRLEALAHDRAVTARFMGRLPHNQLLSRMALATIYVQCSELEGHSKSVIEAMAQGMAVIVADAPGLSDIITHGVSGLRVSADPQALAHAIDGLLDDPDWRETLGATAARVSHASYALPLVLAREAEAHRLAMRLGAARPSAEQAA